MPRSPSPAIGQQRPDIETMWRTSTAASTELESVVNLAPDASAVNINSIPLHATSVDQAGDGSRLDPTWRPAQPAAPVPRGASDTARFLAQNMPRSWKDSEQGSHEARARLDRKVYHGPSLSVSYPQALQLGLGSIDVASNQNSNVSSNAITHTEVLSKPFTYHNNFSFEEGPETALPPNSNMTTGNRYQAADIPQYSQESAPPFAGIDGLRVSSDSSGRVLDSRGKTVGAVLEGDRRRLMGLEVDVNGLVLDRERQVVGSILHIPQWHSRSTTINSESAETESAPPSTGNGPVTPILRAKRYQGNFILDLPLPQEFLQDIPHARPPERDEFTHMRYTAATCAPEQLYSERYTLRPYLFAKPRVTEMVIATVIDISTKPSQFASFLNSLFVSLSYLDSASPEKNPWWKSLVVLVIGHGGVQGEINDMLAKIGIMPWFEPVEDANVTVVFEGVKGDIPEMFDNGVRFPLFLNGRSITARIHEVSAASVARWQGGRHMLTKVSIPLKKHYIYTQTVDGKPKEGTFLYSLYSVT